ncbi:DUF72 domain-containing protein [Ramlibacter sp. PS3R-8]|uniref:DUF72 domain-containing protein n=1 Tax=Ramlibacter sp. PS3R-8 TaxID=3133437 RepID=UPI0030A0F989
MRVGTAGWTLPREVQDRFGPGDSHLARYASVFPAVEINSSFHRPHQRSLYEKWAASVPGGFRFCAKLPKTITHERRLVDCEPLVEEFLSQAGGLGDKLGCLLVQLPPSFAFDAALAATFLHMLRRHWPGAVAMEPRHATWFEAEADALLRAQEVARVLADPVRHAPGAAPGGWPGRIYLRLHGSPRVYYSSYEPALVQALARRILAAEQAGAEVWCIFDNTASGAAAGDALFLRGLLEQGR